MPHDEQTHETVLLDEAVRALVNGRETGCYVDGTFGRGGHTRRLLSVLGHQATVIAVDKDPQAAKLAQAWCIDEPRLQFFRGSFAELPNYIAQHQQIAQNHRNAAQQHGDDSQRKAIDAAEVEKGLIDGLLLDLGVSSPQLDDAARGFSFMRDGPLDMRMDPQVGLSAAEWIAQVDEGQLAYVFKTFGEERFAKRIAKAVVEARRQQPIVTTSQLAELIKVAHPRWEPSKHPATRCFQAIRIYLNKELDDLQTVLEASVRCLRPGGRLVVISFHSLEDRVVKQFIQTQASGPALPRGLPVHDSDIVRTMKKIGRHIKPGADEIQRNVRARSAVMRVAEKR